MFRWTFFLLIICFGAWFAGVSLWERSTVSEYELEIPKGFPKPVIPANNELTQERIDLGRLLFYDPVLSVDSTVSCGTCHKAEFGFADSAAVTPGVAGRLAMRNAPTLTNVAYNPTFLFDGFLKTLEMQVLVPVQEHAEMDFNIVDVANRLKRNPVYVQMSHAAYAREPDPFVITRALAAFERTLISGNSRFDQQVYQGKHVLSPSEKRGMKLFFVQLHCIECHSGFNFTNFTTQNNGLYEHYADSGRMRVTKLAEDRAKFKVPTLRNIALTAPYMHDGSIPTLEGVIRHYESGGKDHFNKNDVIQRFQLTRRQRKDLIHFLEALTDVDFIENPNFLPPGKP